MKIAVVGSRNFKHIDFAVDEISDTLNSYEVPYNEDVFLISGGAIGIDQLAEKIADQYKIEKKIFKPDWDKYGKRAGALRNQKIVDEADFILAFWDGKSKGTKITIDMAIKSCKPIDIYVRK